ncbi:hypothetical protein HMI55_001749 [Coelomomyces lativittatus]|nr:hypothetical protein HMI55_001749 [Coelomomyces lativittatus]
MDPLIEIKLGPIKKLSKVSYNGHKSPKWDEKITLILDELHASLPITLDVKNNERSHDPIHIGGCHLSSWTTQPSQSWYTLETSDHKFAGEIEIKVWYEPLPLDAEVEIKFAPSSVAEVSSMEPVPSHDQIHPPTSLHSNSSIPSHTTTTSYLSNPMMVPTSSFYSMPTPPSFPPVPSFHTSSSSIPWTAPSYLDPTKENAPYPPVSSFYPLTSTAPPPYHPPSTFHPFDSSIHPSSYPIPNEFPSSRFVPPPLPSRRH